MGRSTSSIPALFHGLAFGSTRPFGGRTTKSAQRRRGRSVQVLFESLEPRLALTVYNVTNVNDKDAGSLRQAIVDVNANPGANTITFQNLANGVITLATALPTLTNPSGTTFTFGGNTTAVTLDGGSGTAADGLTIGAGANGVVINGLNLTISNFDSGLVFLGGSTGSTINGVTLTNNTNGIELVGGVMTGTSITGNSITWNSGNGIRVEGGITGLTIGGTAAAAQNTVSNNEGDGMSFQSGTYTNTVVQGNSITSNDDGITLGGGSGAVSGLQIGGAASGAGNTILSNAADGVHVFQGSYTGTVIQGNTIRENGRHGIELSPAGKTLTDLTIGGKVAGQGNTIAANYADGIAAMNGSYAGTVVQGNTIRENMSSGISINLQGGGAAFSGLAIGGGTGAGNTISGNVVDGVLLNSGAFSTTFLKGNTISDNGRHGVDFLATSGQKMTGFILGGTGVGERNTISGNTGSGIFASKGDYTSTSFVANSITGNGIGISLGDASNLTVGGLTAASQNVISGSTTVGLFATGVLTGTKVLGNAFATNPIGVSLQDAQGVSVGAADAGGGNTITGGTTGVRAVGNLSNSLVAGNAITGQTTGIQLVNASGAAAAQPFFIGGAATTVGNGVGNYVASTVHGLYAAGSLTNTTIAGNIFSASALGGNAMVLENATGLTVGGSTAGTGNTLTAAKGNALYAAGYMTGSGFYKNTLTASVNGALLNSVKNFLFGIANNPSLGNVVQYNQVGVYAMGNCTGSGVCYTTWLNNVRKLQNTATGLVVFPKA